MAPPAQIITVAVDMSKAFDTVNMQTLIRKLQQTNIPGTIIKFIANYIKGRKVYTTYKHHTSIQRQFKTGVPQGIILSSTLFNINTADFPPPRTPVQVMPTQMTSSSHIPKNTSAAKKYIQPYLQSHTISRQNNLHSVHSRPCGIYEQSGPKNTQHCTTHGNPPEIVFLHYTQNSHTAHTFTTSQYTHTNL